MALRMDAVYDRAIIYQEPVFLMLAAFMSALHCQSPDFFHEKKEKTVLWKLVFPGVYFLA
jgi:hypothetical protein